jgi:hypothetical protein
MSFGPQMPQRVGQHGLFFYSTRGRVHAAFNTGFVDASAASVFAIGSEASRVPDGGLDKVVWAWHLSFGRLDA